MWFTITILSIIVLSILFKLFHRFYFLRDPSRLIPIGINIVSPADGRIIKIIRVNTERVKINKFLGKIFTYTKEISDDCLLISIFMSPFDVHRNRAPVEGVVQTIKHEYGTFFAANDFRKSLTNEKNEIVIENPKIKVKMIQIAGFLARRIVCRVKEKQVVKKGEKVGLINLGSQVTLILPYKKIKKLCVRVGERVIAGETVIGEY